MVNVERSLAIGAENGGHDVSGHVDCTATIVNRISTGSNTCITFEVPADKIKYIFSLGFIAINGVSLTISDVDKEKSTFSVWLIPETLRRTNLEQLELRDFVNLEFHKGTQVVVDTINDAVERVLTHAIRNGQLLPEHVPALLNAVPTPALLTFSGGALSKK
jgi:riboflavin synthase